MSLEILHLLGVATLQSVPSPGRRRYGVPPGGPFDRESAALANALAGNPPGAMVLELSNAAAKFRASGPLMLACVGAPVRLVAAGRELPCQSGFSLAAGETLEVSAPAEGTRAYLAVGGGWRPMEVAQGSLLMPTVERPLLKAARLAKPPTSLDRLRLRCVSGPQAAAFAAQGWLNESYTVSPAADRVGIRLTGAPLPTPDELASEPACPGAVQVTNDGQLIVLGPDGPTIGGYPKVAVVCSADLDKLGQLRTGDVVSFEQIDLKAAQSLAVQEERRLASRVGQILYAQRKS